VCAAAREAGEASASANANSKKWRTKKKSPLYDKGYPILGVFVHGRSFLEFWTPNVFLLKFPGG
jgi:hypothetical protein